MFNATPQHSYSRVPVEPHDGNKRRAPKEPSWWSRVTFGWIPGRLSTTQQSLDELVPGQRSAWWNWRNFRHMWIKHARSEKTRDKEPRLWRVILSFVMTGDFALLFVLQAFILCARVLQPTMFVTLFSPDPLLLYGSPVPWYCAVIAGYWLSVSLESLALSHYTFSAHVTSAAVKSGLTGLLYDKVMRLKQATLADYTSGHVINLISKDLHPIGQCVYSVPFLFTAPVELLVMSQLLLMIVGWEALIGIAYMLVCTLLRCGVGRVYGKLRRVTAFFSDQRLGLFSEVICGIRAIKMNVWEEVFEKLLKDVRRKELPYIRRKALVLGAFLSVQKTVPIISSLVSIVTLMICGQELTRINVFLIMLTMYILDSSCGDSFARGTEVLVRTVGRLYRIEKFLLVDFPSPSFYENIASRPHGTDGSPPSNSPPHLSLIGVCCEREYDLADIELNYITFSYEGAQLVALTGPPEAGAGTSLVCEAILKEVPLSRGRINETGDLAYVGQKPWIFSGTVRENILFGEHYSEERFLAVITACKLDDIIGGLPDGDMTKIGDGGFWLTPGQRELISLARASYSSAYIILMDNPLSHVSDSLANQIFNECIIGFLASRLRVVVTRRADFLEKCPHVLLMEDGIIIREGSLDKLRESGEYLTWLGTDTSHEGEDGEEVEEPMSGGIRSSSLKETSVEKIIDRDEGFAVYLRYARQAGWLPLLSVVGVLLIVAPGAVLASLGIWFARIADLPLEYVHFSVSTALVGAYALIPLLRALFLLVCGLRSSKRIHERAISTLLKAPVQHFENGEEDALLRVFSKDVECLDEKLPPDILRFFQSVVEHVAVAAVIKVTAPWAILAFIPAFLISLIVGKYYLHLERQARDYESNSLKPLLVHFSDTFMGAVTIRACQKEKYFKKEFFRLQNQHTTAVCMRSAAEQWLAVRHLAVTSLFMCIATVIVFLTSNSTLVALSLTFDRQLVVGIAIVPFLFANIEQDMTSAARLMSFFDVRSESGYGNVTKPPEDWPSEGAVRISDSLLAYPLGRRRVSFETFTLDIEPGEKVFITGQKDAKAISFAAKLMLISERSQWEVLVDDIPLTTINLPEARKAFCALQRKPFMFTASLRKNLDPEGLHKDGELWNVLETVRMKEYVKGLPRKLNYIMTQPSRFSDSQLQLLSVARALLQEKRIIVIDEVVSGVDFNTLLTLNSVVKHQFGNCTVITVAYGPIGLETILHHDRVVVMEQGRIVEMDSPQVLLGREGSLLSRFLIPT